MYICSCQGEKMIDERAYELLCCQLGLANEEKAGLRKQVNELMRKAVNYTINQWKSLKNILKDGAAEISNNLCEQRMKPVKLLLKNCMNIGSEDAAGNSAFIFSLIESCKLNDIDPQDYLKHLFECILHGKDCDKKALLPCFYKSEC